ncbi:hypothetical protein J6590_064329 [Homalodisca vitripennis]|nr:hypothetical protein J6590_064329 [Homalodisca vitripennis]
MSQYPHFVFRYNEGKNMIPILTITIQKAHLMVGEMMVGHFSLHLWAGKTAAESKQLQLILK